MTQRIIADDVSVVVCGEAGQGVQTVEKMLSRLFKLSGFNVFATKEYMSRVRGGSNSTELRVSSIARRAFLRRIDILVPLDAAALAHLSGRITPDTLIIGDAGQLSSDRPVIDIPFGKLAADIGGALYANTIAAAAILALFGIDGKSIEERIAGFFAKKSADIIDKNRAAARAGIAAAAGIVASGVTVKVAADPAVASQMLMNGAEAMGLGAVAGGCDFMAAYPMTPSTGVLTFLAEHAREFGIIVEQAEDEISAVNMAVGAWYAGARAMVTTAGGGFALMTEGVSLAGMMESPLVINIGQRPAPATGLPTRTEQGDLEQVLYAGHGEFPRVVLAPATVEDAFFLTQKAFDLADKYQVPVLLLSDQYLVDSFHNMPAFDLTNLRYDRAITETTAGYQRYRLTPDNISPRGVPGFGAGFVAADSDEHDEDGRITERADVRVAMMDKRLAKAKLVFRGVIPPDLSGPKDYRHLVIGWGSTAGVIHEAVERLGRKDVAVLHFKQVYPVHAFAGRWLGQAASTIMVENNATGQFAKLLKLSTGIDMTHKILKYDGMPFSVEELTERLAVLLG